MSSIFDNNQTDDILLSFSSLRYLDDLLNILIIL